MLRGTFLVVLPVLLLALTADRATAAKIRITYELEGGIPGYEDCPQGCPGGPVTDATMVFEFGAYGYGFQWGYTHATIRSLTARASHSAFRFGPLYHYVFFQQDATGLPPEMSMPRLNGSFSIGPSFSVRSGLAFNTSYAFFNLDEGTVELRLGWLIRTSKSSLEDYAHVRLRGQEVSRTLVPEPAPDRQGLVALAGLAAAALLARRRLA